MNFDYPLHRIAIVVSADDPEQSGRVQVRILPELHGVADDDLPWASPHSQSKRGTAEGALYHNPPDEDSRIHIIIQDKYWDSIDYVVDEGYRIPGVYDYATAVGEIESAIGDDIESLEYPNPSIHRSTDGTIFFHNHSNGEVGYVHPSGLYVISDGSGSIKVRFMEKAQIKNEDDSLMLEMEGDTIKASAAHIQVEGAGDHVALFTPLEEILLELLDHVHMAPSGQTLPPIDAGATPLAALKGQLKDIQSEIIETD